MLGKIKELLAGWSVLTLAKKLAERYVPIAAAGAVAFFSKWAPESTADTAAARAAVASLLWILFESARNAALYAVRRKQEK